MADDAPGDAPAKVEAPEYAPKVDGAPASGDRKKSKKSSRKSGKKSLASRGPTALPNNRGTGLEEYFADPPMTAKEAEEERNSVYSDELPFEDRIQACIIRFRSRRRLQEEAARYFNEYLFLGGIDTSPNPFSGQDPGELKTLTPAERRDATASDGIHAFLNNEDSLYARFYTGDLEHWEIDFTGVAAGFFSMSMGSLTGFEPEPLERAVSVIENFLRYTIQHDVCPEYSDDLHQALKVCDDAREEWPMILRVQAALPGQFNMAASLRFGVLENSDWALDPSFYSSMPDPNAALLTSLALMNEPKLFSKAGPNMEIIREFDCTVEIISITRPDEDIIQRFKSLNVADQSMGLKPVGKIRVVPATIEDEWEPVHIEPVFHTGFMTLFFDNVILADFKPGMKMSLRVCQLNINLKFVKTLYHLVPSFHTFLPQDMMRHFKPPRENERAAPSIHDRSGDQNDERRADHGDDAGAKPNDETSETATAKGED